MDSKLYEEILFDIKAMNCPNSNDRVFASLHDKYSNIPEQTLRSIIALWYQRKTCKSAYKIKELDIYSMYKKLRNDGIQMACLHLSQKLDYPASLVAKIVVKGYVSVLKDKIQVHAKEVKDLRKPLCSYCQKEKRSLEEIESSRELAEIECSQVQKHNDPRVELALNLFHETDEIGRFFLEKFKPQDGSNKASRLRFTSQNETSFLSVSNSSQINFSDTYSDSTDAKINFRDLKISDNSYLENDSSLITKNIDNVSSSAAFNDSNASDISFKSSTGLCTCINSDPDDSESDDEYVDDNNRRIRDFIENSSFIDDPVFAKDILVCTLSDDQYGPNSDIIANASGITYEFLLEEHIKNIGLSYKTEDKLRGVGVDKTPDFILQVPVAVDNFIINWIESKALFADYKLHQELKKNQYRNYLNRFGPGLVIYWRGYVADLPDLYLVENKQILVRDTFPAKESFTFMSNKFKVWMNEKV